MFRKYIKISSTKLYILSFAVLIASLSAGIKYYNGMSKLVFIIAICFIHDMFKFVLKKGDEQN